MRDLPREVGPRSELLVPALAINTGEIDDMKGGLTRRKNSIEIKLPLTYIHTTIQV